MSGRREAANLLRAIRAVGPQRAGDLLDWAVTLMPDSVAVQRFAVQALLADGDCLGAESAVARALLQRPNNASLCLLRAECLASRQQWYQALAEALEALAQRPHHRRTRELAATASIACGEFHQATTLLDEAPSLPDDRFRSLQVQALLGLGQVQQARWLLEAMHVPPAVLSAAVLQAEGRLLDAAEVLERALDGACDDADQTLHQLLSILERIGDTKRIEKAAARITRNHPRSRVLVGKVLLSQGRFRLAAVHAAMLLHSKTHQAQALPTLVVAAALLGRSRLAKRALARLRRSKRGICARTMAERWQRGMLGQCLRAQHNARHAGCDPGSGVLQALLDEARRGASGGLTKSRRIGDSAGGVAQLSERKNVLVSSPVDC